MAGHSKWAKIKRQKGAEDAKRGKVFTQLGNAIAIAAKNGADPSMNPSLALAIDKAKQANMPGANIERSIKRGSGELGGDQIEEYLFEAYGPGGVGIIIEAVSDNRNRTTSEMKSLLSKNGGTLAEPGAVAYQFKRLGVIRLYPVDDKDEATLTALDSGAEDVIDTEDGLLVYTPLKELHSAQEKLEAAGLRTIEAELQYVPNDLINLTDKSEAQKTIKLMEAIEEHEEVTNTYSNFDIPEDLLG